MVRSIIAPNRYVQGPGVLAGLGGYISGLGGKALILGGPTALALVREAAGAGMAENGVTVHWQEYSGHCTIAATERLVLEAGKVGAKVVVGVGGGRAIDSAKAVSHETGAALIIAPTVASSDAPCSALAVQYTEDHMLERFLILRSNPDVVLVDSRVIARAPSRFLVAGMGDAMATWFEADTCTKSSAQSMAGGLATGAALAMARLCFDTLMKYGKSAKLAVERSVVTPALERVIEANILLSGIGFESAGLAAAHGIHEGLATLPGAEGAMHGELVGFGALCQLVMENHEPSEIETVLGFCNSVGLPVSLAQLGAGDADADSLARAAAVACGEGLTTHNCYFPVTPELVLDAIVGADALGRASLPPGGERL